MDHLYFGERARWRARRRARFKRIAVVSWMLTLSAAALGIAGPGPGVAFNLLTDVVADDDMVQVASLGVETSETAASAMKFRKGVFDERPLPSPSASATAAAETTTVAAASGGSVTDIIYAAAAEYGVSGDWMISIAQCESNLNPSAVNPAGYHGLFQYDQQTWAAYGSGSIYDPSAQARTTAMLLAAGQSGRWPSCA